MLLVVALGLGLGLAGGAQAVEIVVDPVQLLPVPGPGGWWFAQETGATGSTALVTGPGTPPGRDGSARITLDAAADGIVLGTVGYGGTELADLTNLEYSTYRSSSDPGGNLAITLQINIDYDLTDADTSWQGRIVFEPYFTIGSGNVSENVWQTWDPTDGPTARWWGTGTPRVGNVVVTQQCPQSSPCTWNQLKAFYPNAGVSVTIPAIGFKAGSAWAGFAGNVDRFTLGINSVDTTFDFEACADRYVDDSGSDTDNICHDSGTPCATIQRAIDVACEGDTIYVGAGTYAESPDVDKSVTIESTDGPSLTEIELQTGPTYLGSLQISGADVTVEGFTITGRDAACPTLAATNVTITTAPDDVTLRNNRIRVGQVGACTNGDDGFGLLTYYDTNVPAAVTSVTVEDNAFEPLTPSGGRRAFYVNPGVGSFVFADNTITGLFTGSSLTQAQSAALTGNTVDGQGLGGAGLGTWGYPDASVWGAATFSGNVITGVTNAITLNESNNAVITCNRLQANTRGVRIADGFGTLNFDPTTSTINTNSLIGNATAGVDNAAATPGTVDATGNWWGCIAGPGNPGCDASLGDVDESSPLASVPTCVNCTMDSQCQDGLGCNGSEICNGSNVCVDGPDPDCSDQCFTGVCLEPGICQAEPFGTACDSGLDVCSETDECDGIDGSGICLNTGGGGDAEPDLTCELDDNCPGVSNPSQSDVDSDGLGDECDPDDSPFSLVVGRARLVSTRSGGSNGSLSIGGLVNVNDEQGAFVTKLLADQVSLQLTDSGVFDATLPFTDCTVSASGRRYRCVNATRTVRALFTLRRSSNLTTNAPFVYDFRISAKKLTPAVAGETQPVGPVAIRLDEGAVNRHDTIGDLSACLQRSTRRLVCREP